MLSVLPEVIVDMVKLSLTPGWVPFLCQGRPIGRCGVAVSFKRFFCVRDYHIENAARFEHTESFGKKMRHLGMEIKVLKNVLAIYVPDRAIRKWPRIPQVQLKIRPRVKQVYI
jgi:hypothetical protein